MSCEEHLNASINLAYIWYTVLHMLASGQYGKDIWAGLMQLLQPEEYGMRM